MKENLETLEKKHRSLRKMVDDPAMHQYVNANHKQAEFTEIQQVLRVGQTEVDTLRGFTDQFVKWDEGNMNLNTFVEEMRVVYNGHPRQGEVIGKLQDFLLANKARVDRYGKIGQDPERTHTAITRWRKNTSTQTPYELLNVLRNYYGSRPTAEQQQTLNAVEAYLSQPENEEILRLWDKGANVSSKITVINEVTRIANIDAIQKEIHENRELRQELSRIAELQEIIALAAGRVSELNEEMTKKEDMLRNLEKENQKVHGGHSDHGHHGFLGTNWYSLEEVWEALKQVKEAYTTAWHERSHHHAAEIAKGIGDSLSWVPFIGMDANIALKKAQESHNEKEKGEFKEYLKSNNFKYQQLFEGHDSLMHQNHSNPNKVRAILEYAASHGWLYDLDLSAGDSEKRVMGQSLKSLMHDYDDHEILNYYNALRGENSSGRESEIKAKHDTVKDIESIPYFIKEIENEMKDMNLWAAIGIAERAIERGLIGETIGWVMTTIMRVLDENPLIKKKASVDFFDKLGALSLYHTDCTMGEMKVARKDLYKWSQEEGRGTDYSTLGTTFKAIKEIENDIKTRTGRSFDSDDGGKYSKSALNRYVAQVLATHTVEIEDTNHRTQRFSIFDRKYSYYTDRTLHQGQVSVSKEDEDYFRERTGNLRADGVVIKQLLTLTSTGQFTNESRALAYITNVLKVNEELEKKNMADAAAHYRENTGRRLREWIEIEILRNPRSNPILEAKTGHGKYFLRELFRQKFVGIDVLEKAIRDKWDNDKMARILLADVAPKHPLLAEKPATGKSGE